jgi:AraC-like DNA-binding protein
MDATVSAGLFQLLRSAEPALTDAVLARAGLHWDALGARVDHQLVLALCEAGAARDPLFGVKAATQLGTSALELVDFLVRSSATFMQALQTTSRYRRLLHEALLFRVTATGEDTVVDCGLDVKAHPALLEFGVSLLALALRNTGYRGRGAIYFAHAAPHELDAYQALLGMPVHFAASFTGGRFETTALERPIPAADPQLHALLVKHADTLLDRLPADDGVVTRVRTLVSGQLDRPPNFDHVARQLRMSPRTLRRRLVQGGVSYQALVDDMRREIALRYVQHDAEDLAFMLGFSDASAFRRAFKRWTGSTPRELRKG